ncbi:hypothetical protein GCM10008090_33170 [Arenicella chitinivorans]|uniref:Uncharacterized protein n=1 Tax=Arenicella chitinivorans TaxID=1329800 RepID=A0A918S2J6_9GAMM|nr:hypothetical protein [Arenicella chitinivorans]GHA20627.1 hypothetical protein GCM10008090_33170 [Arenicella chitinivorans]
MKITYARKPRSSIAQRGSSNIPIKVCVSFLFLTGTAYAQSTVTHDHRFRDPVHLRLLSASGTNALSDHDKDGVPDQFDAFPDDPTESVDDDNDGIGDNRDPDPAVADSLVIVDTDSTVGSLYLRWLAASPDECRVLYGVQGRRPEQFFSHSGEFYMPNVGDSGTYQVLIECYELDGSSVFSLPATVEVLK